MTPSTPQALRASLDARITAQANAAGVDAGRVRRRVVFQRILRRLGPDNGWVLKGGYLLETRLGAGARSTKDLDLAAIELDSQEQLRDRLELALDSDPDRDYFNFRIGPIHSLAADSNGLGGWRVSVAAMLAGRTFSDVRIDVVQRTDEIRGGTELIELTPPVTASGFTPVSINAVDIAQHAAEKFHALCRIYGGNRPSRPSTRVKDLLDIALMAESGLLPDPRLPARLITVFLARDAATPPATLPDPPASWREDFVTLARGTILDAVSFDDAFATATEVFRAATATLPKPDGATES